MSKVQVDEEYLAGLEAVAGTFMDLSSDSQFQKVIVDGIQDQETQLRLNLASMAVARVMEMAPQPLSGQKGIHAFLDTRVWPQLMALYRGEDVPEPTGAAGLRIYKDGAEQ